MILQASKENIVLFSLLLFNFTNRTLGVNSKGKKDNLMPGSNDPSLIPRTHVMEGELTSTGGGSMVSTSYAVR